jgi:thioesterase domain-containing protein
MTPHGKVDYAALPGPGSRKWAEERETPSAPARTALEQVLADIWASTLNADRVGVHDDFFSLGGHSLLAMELIHEINSALQLELPLRLLFTAPTVADQALEIERMRAVAADGPRHPSPTLVPLRVGGSKPPFFLVAGGFGGEAELIVYAGLARYLDRERPFYGLRIRGVDDLTDPHETVEKMAAEHVAEIRGVQPHGPYLIGGSCVGGVVAFEIAQQLLAQGEAIGSLILIDSRFPSQGWLLRFVLGEFWRSEVLPLTRSYRRGAAGLRAALKEKITMLTNPSPEQRVGRKKVQIGWKYLRRTLRYSPRPYPGPITLILCEAQKTADPTRVWCDLAAGGLDIHEVPGDHFTHLRDHAALTAAHLNACLEAAVNRLHKV